MHAPESNLHMKTDLTDVNDTRKNLRVETDTLEFWTKVVNIGLVPLLVALTGLALALRRRKAAAAAAAA